MERGDFYASTGVQLKDIQFGRNTLAIEIDAEEGVSYTTKFIGTYADTTHPGELFASQKGTEATYTFSNNEMYVRAKIISDKRKENPYREDEVEVAWTQPVVNQNFK